MFFTITSTDNALLPLSGARTVSVIIMELGLEVYRNRFARVETDLSKQVTEGLELIKVHRLFTPLEWHTKRIYRRSFWRSWIVQKRN